MSKIIIQTENMGFTYPDGTVALRDINIEIEELFYFNIDITQGYCAIRICETHIFSLDNYF